MPTVYSFAHKLRRTLACTANRESMRARWTR